MSDEIKNDENQEASGESQQEVNSEEQAPVAASNSVKLNGLLANKLGMATVYSEDGRQIPVTVLELKKWIVTQIKTEEKDGYSAVQVALFEKNKKNVKKAEQGHFKDLCKDKAVSQCLEFRQEVPEGIQVGQEVSWESLVKGDKVQTTARSKGRGFAGTMKRFNFAGGPAAHGSTFHRQPGSVGNRTWPGRIMPGKKLPGHYGDKNITVKNVEVVDVQLNEGLLLVKGPVPGARNGLVQLWKQ